MDYNMSVEEKFRMLMEGPQEQTASAMGPVKIIFPDGNEITTEKLVAYIDGPVGGGRYYTAGYGTFTINDLMIAQHALIGRINQQIKELLHKWLEKKLKQELKQELKQAGFPGAVIVEFELRDE